MTSIGIEAFSHCVGLTSVTIGSGVKSIDYRAFYGQDIRTVISLIKNPNKIDGISPENLRTFSLNTFKNAKLYVPKGTIEKYNATSGWKDFANIMEGTPTN